MSPYEIRMYVSSYTEDKLPLYKVDIYDRDGKIVKSSDEVIKEEALVFIVGYCEAFEYFTSSAC